MTRLVLLSLLALGACDLQLTAATTPPPGGAANLDSDDRVITLSRGVALGVDCRDGNHLCTGMDIEVDDPAIAEAYVSFDTELDYTIDGPAVRTSLVVVGKSAGTTSLYIDADGGDVSYDVVVLPRE